MQLVKLQSPIESKSVSDQAKVTILKQYITQKLQYSSSSNLGLFDNPSNDTDELKIEATLGLIDDLENKKVSHKDENSERQDRKEVPAIRSEYTSCCVDQSIINDAELEKANARLGPDNLFNATHLQLQEISNVIKKNSKFAQIKEGISKTKRTSKS